MKRPVKIGIVSLKALGAFVALGVAAHAGLPYLPQIGPPPLRMLVMKSPLTAVAKFLTNSAASATNPPPAGETAVSASATNAMAPSGFVGPVAPMSFLSASPEQSLGDAFTASVFMLPTPDLLGISPQMLASYFRPVQLGTNYAALTGPFHVTFMPPLPPDKSSHAEYIVK